MNLIIFFIIYNWLYWILDLFSTKTKNKEFLRKIAHIWTWLITYFSLDYLQINDYWILLIVFIIEFILLRKFQLCKFLTSNKRWFWDLYFIVWQTVLVWVSIYDIDITKSWLLILTLADWFAPFGKNIFDKKIFRQKTIWWSWLFYIITLIILLFFYWFTIKILIISLIISFIELVCSKWTDNLIVPIFTILILFCHDKIFYL